MVVFQWFMISIADDAHHRLNKSLTRAEIPVFESGHEIGIKVSFLVKHVYNFVARTGNSCDVDHIERLEYLIHTFLILIHRSYSPHIVIIARDTIFSWEGRK